VIPTSFSSFFQGSPPAQSSFFAFTKLNYTIQNGRIAMDQDRAASWVNSAQMTVDGRRAGATSRDVAACQSNFDQGHTWYRWKPSPTCPAHAALSSPKEATSKDECETVIGAGLDTDGAASAKLTLRHEAYHVLMGCAIATQGNHKIDQGAAPATVLAAVKHAHNTHQDTYDHDTGHGCNAEQQAAWEQRIDNPQFTWLP
jgi:hypothetical protein